MGLFSFRATFSEVEGDFEGKKVEIARKGDALELTIITKKVDTKIVFVFFCETLLKNEVIFDFFSSL